MSDAGGSEGFELGIRAEFVHGGLGDEQPGRKPVSRVRDIAENSAFVCVEESTSSSGGLPVCCGKVTVTGPRTMWRASLLEIAYRKSDGQPTVEELLLLEVVRNIRDCRKTTDRMKKQA